LPYFCQSRRQVNGCGGLANAALLVRNAENFSHEALYVIDGQT